MSTASSGASTGASPGVPSASSSVASSAPSSQPPTSQPSSPPPTSQPTTAPPSSQPTSQPPSSQPTSQPPTSQPPSSQPTSAPPSSQPTSAPPSSRASSQPSSQDGPSSSPSDIASSSPSSASPSSTPTSGPSSSSGSSSSAAPSSSAIDTTANLALSSPATTLHSTVVFVTTNSAGQVTTSTPSVVTELSTVTGSNGATSVVTIIASNPTPFNSDGNHTGGSQFFTNKGAVAGVFLIVGLAAASIVLFLFFFIKRRHRNRRLEYDTAVASTLAAAGYNRQPLDGDDYDEGGGMRQRRRSSPSALATVSSLGTQAAAVQPYTDDPTGRRAEFDPYSAYSAAPPQTPPASARRDGYVPARTSSPPLGHSHSASTSSMGHVMGCSPRRVGRRRALQAPSRPRRARGRRRRSRPRARGGARGCRATTGTIMCRGTLRARCIRSRTGRRRTSWWTSRRGSRLRCATCLMDSAPARTFRGKRRGARSPARSPRHDISRSTCLLHGGPLLPYAVLALAYYPPSPS
ncbi:hypothetical protein PHLGIDRAFT_384031 [Phlebiopsis gigantea 11061_1 CR5-6]|uniref:REJ domain-containing protein n=1 Tax=Phlebiopsis gigantea (strain 11061_1 CR5-6) TaxID=745531 RepID=A0A0C3RP61_PHLG1|nr:hypothetical protein PHLGIDRAFT_384031 [Phlebiopsis gigantea 11061_1 CR5-6]